MLEFAYDKNQYAQMFLNDFGQDSLGWTGRKEILHTVFLAGIGGSWLIHALLCSGLVGRGWRTLAGLGGYFVYDKNQYEGIWYELVPS